MVDVALVTTSVPQIPVPIPTITENVAAIVTSVPAVPTQISRVLTNVLLVPILVVCRTGGARLIAALAKSNQ